MYGSIAILAVLIFRFLFRRLPKKITVLLWLVAALRLVCPLNFKSSFSFFNLKIFKAKESFEEVSAMAPSTTSSHIDKKTLEYARYIMDNYGKAIHDYTTILEHDRQNTDALNRRAFAYYQNREYDKAENDYNSVLAIKPSDYASALGKALVMQKTFRLGEAIKRMEFLVVEHPDRAELYAVRASMYKESGKMELALVDISRAIQLEPKNPAYYSQRADIYEAQGKKKMAAADRRKAASR